MTEYYKYRVKLAKLFRQKESLRSAFTADIRKAHKDSKSREDIQSLEHQSCFEENMIDEEIAILVTDNLILKAKHRFMPIPSHDTDEMWVQCNAISNRYVLTNQGISQLRSSLQKERKERAELVVMVLAVLMGIIGAITGLVAVIIK